MNAHCAIEVLYYIDSYGQSLYLCCLCSRSELFEPALGKRCTCTCNIIIHLVCDAEFILPIEKQPVKMMKGNAKRWK